MANTDSVLDSLTQFNQSNFYVLWENGNNGRYQTVAGGQYAHRPDVYLANRSANDPDFLAKLIQTAAPALVTANEGFSAVTEMLDSPIARYTLMGIAIAAGPVKFALGMAIQQSPFGQFVGNHIAAAHEKFTGYVAKRGGISTDTAIKATAGALGLMTLMMSLKQLPQGLRALKASVGHLKNKYRRGPQKTDELNLYSEASTNTSSAGGGHFKSYRSTKANINYETKVKVNVSGKQEVTITSNQFLDENGKVTTSKNTRFPVNQFKSTFDPKTGELYIDFMESSNNGLGIGKEMMSRAIEKIGPEKVKSISGAFDEVNYRKYKEYRDEYGLSATESAFSTPAAKIRIALGFGDLVFNPATLTLTGRRN